MNILCWNVRGAGNPRTLRDLKDVIRLQHPKIVFISESKCGKKKMEKMRVALKYNNCLPIESCGQSDGLCLLWSDMVEVNIRFFLKIMLTVILSGVDNGGVLRVFMVALKVKTRS